MHYCDSCGKKNSINAQYCRYCGRYLRITFEDTQPLPIINDSVKIMPAQKKGSINSCSALSNKTRMFRIRKHAIFSYLASFAIVAILIYVLINFKTIDEYRYLTGALGFSLAIYFYRNA